MKFDIYEEILDSITQHDSIIVLSFEILQKHK